MIFLLAYTKKSYKDFLTSKKRLVNTSKFSQALIKVNVSTIFALSVTEIILILLN